MALVSAVLASACATQRPGAHAAQARTGDAGAPSGPVAEEAEEAEDGGTEGGGEGPEADPAELANADAHPEAGPCPADMVLVETAAPIPRRFCVDMYEASLVEVMADGSEKVFPHYLPVDGHDVRAVSVPGAFPQGYVSEVQAQDACTASGKRLCNVDEWKTACMGPAHTTFPYGEARRPGVCHDSGKSAVLAVFGAKAVAASSPPAAHAPAVTGPAPTAATGKRAHVTKGRAAQASRPRAGASKTPPKGSKPTVGSNASGGASEKKGAARRTTGKKSARPASVDPGVWARLNDPGLGQVEGSLSRTGEHAACVNGFGAFDMVGNLHEWVATDPAAPHGLFAGGYYLDTSQNGDGCNYRTGAHAHDYHDYSTGFRCCSAAAPPRP